jgi:hypothetical protein
LAREELKQRSDGPDDGAKSGTMEIWTAGETVSGHPCIQAHGGVPTGILETRSASSTRTKCEYHGLGYVYKPNLNPARFAHPIMICDLFMISFRRNLFWDRLLFARGSKDCPLELKA